MQGAMATYRQIQEWVKQEYGWTPKSCWIAHCKELRGLARRDAPNRRGGERRVPCPRNKRDPIFSAFRHFMMLTALMGMIIFSVVLDATQDSGIQAKGQTTEIQELRQAAEQGDVEAQFMLGVAHADDLGDTEAVAWLRAAASQGHLTAQLALAARYEGGMGVPQDHGEAIVWYRRAAEQDLTDSQAGPDTLERVMDLQTQAIAQYTLGGLYMEGLGAPENLTEAARWYRRAADHGVVAAQIVLGAMYADGSGVPQDYVRAHMWFNLAAARGNEDARELRDSISASMTGPQIAEAQRAAREWMDAHQ